jgi:hypothetical protein
LNSFIILDFGFFQLETHNIQHTTKKRKKGAGEIGEIKKKNQWLNLLQPTRLAIARIGIYLKSMAMMAMMAMMNIWLDLMACLLAVSLYKQKKRRRGCSAWGSVRPQPNG